MTTAGDRHRHLPGNADRRRPGPAQHQPGASCPASGSGNISTTVNLPSAATATFTVTGTILVDAPPARSSTRRPSPPRPAAPIRCRATTRRPTPTRSRRSADLSITKTDGVTTAVPGRSATYTIVVSNAGPSAASRRQRDRHRSRRPDGRDLDLRRHRRGSVPGLGRHRQHQAVGGPPVGATATYTVTATVAPGATGTLTNTATVSAGRRRDGSDPREQHRDRYRHA